MCNFNKQSDEAKSAIHLFMQNAAKEIGGVNYLLSLIEAIHTKKPTPLMQKSCQIASNNTIIKWNKVIFKDKTDIIDKVLLTYRESDEKDCNIFHEQNPKMKKNILNMVRTLAPLEFVVTPQNPNDGEGFHFKAFQTISDDEVIFNPIFIALFFCSTAFTKNALKYQGEGKV